MYYYSVCYLTYSVTNRLFVLNTLICVTNILFSTEVDQSEFCYWQLRVQE